MHAPPQTGAQGGQQEVSGPTLILTPTQTLSAPVPSAEVGDQSTIKGALASTIVPSPTPMPTPTPRPAHEAPEAEVVVTAGNVRSGPGLAYPVIGQVSRGDTLAVLKRNEPGDWLQIVWGDTPAWLSASLVELNVDESDLEVVKAVDPPPATPTPVPLAPTPRSVQAPKCETVPIRGFGKVWGEHPQVAATLGCPSWPYREEGTDAAVQLFEHGLMLWLAADSSYNGDPVYVLFDTGEYQRFPDMGPADPAAVGDVPDGFHAPGDRFSKVYWEGTGARVQQRLGRAVGPQMESPGAYQQFERGRMFWTGRLDRIFVLYDYWWWDEGRENGTRIRSWTSFEDIFGD